MSSNDNTELPQASPPLLTIEDKLRQLLWVDGFYYDEPPEVTAPLINKLLAIITTETTKARIDELQHTIADDEGAIYYTPDPTNPRFGEDDDVSQSDRLKALQKEQL